MASNALYMREPINKMENARGNKNALRPIGAEPPPEFQATSEQAFSGLPDFPPLVIHIPQKWRLADRRKRRLVIEEVMPLACAYLIRRFRPQLIYLVRHAAAVALSYCQLGWWSPEKISWYEMGATQSRISQEVLGQLDQYLNKRLIFYEDLCANPTQCFVELFSFAGLAWGDHITTHIAEATSGGTRSKAYTTARLSREMQRARTREIKPEALQQLRAGYESVTLPWYKAESDWQIDPSSP
jgi:hypothetical protein